MLVPSSVGGKGDLSVEREKALTESNKPNKENNRT